MSLRDIPLTTIDGSATSLAEYGDGAVLVVNVASRCAHTPQYAGLERLQQRYADRGLTVLGFPSNQFLQEPGGAESIARFCSLSYGVTFPLMAKTRLNGRNAHPLFAELTRVADDTGRSGRVRWNFEKFVVTADDEVTRFRSEVQPEDPAVIGAIEAALPVR